MIYKTNYFSGILMAFFLGMFMGDNLREGTVLVFFFQMFFSFFSYLSYICSITKILFVYFFLPPLRPLFLLSFLFKFFC